MYVFLGTLFTPEDEKRLLKNSKAGLQGAANNYQWALIRGLSQVCGEPIPVINSVPMGTYPRYCKILFERGSVTKTSEVEVRSHGYINLPVIKQMQRRSYAYRSIKKLIRGSEPVTVVAYSLYTPYLRALYKLKKKCKQFQYILVIPDLPGIYGLESRNPLIRMIQRISGEKEFKMARAADGYVILTEQMAQPLSIQHKPYVVIEGIYNGQGSEIASPAHECVPVILYTGALDKAMGLDTLVQAFCKLPEGSAQLHLAGNGPYVKELEQICLENPDVRYLGYLSKGEIDVLQRSAAVLVNPRPAGDDYTKYSFPSKTIEYLSTGTPVVMNKLPGIPEDYNEHLFYTEYSDAESLAKALQRVLETDEQTLAAHGAAAKTFIENEKSGAAQAKKILELANRLPKHRP